MKMIAIIVPCFNEEKRMDISRWQTIVNRFAGCHWVFVNDGSSDNTSLLINKLTGQNVYQLDLPTNHGKGNAIRAGLLYIINPSPLTLIAELDFSRIGYIDSDGAFDTLDIELLLTAAEEKIELVPAYNVVIGSRVKLAGRQIERKRARHYLGRLISTFVCQGWEEAPYDTQSGFKIFGLDSSFREAVKTPFRTSWFFDIELLLRLDASDSLRIWEVPLMKWEDIGESSIKVSKYLSICRQIITIRSLVKFRSKGGKI